MRRLIIANALRSPRCIPSSRARLIHALLVLK